MSGEALAMRVGLARLAAHHGVAARPGVLSLAAPIDGPVDVSGLASTGDIDLERTKFDRYCFRNPCLQIKTYEFPQLLYKHDPAQVAGEITALEYTEDGRGLRISATVTHEQAKLCPAFSIQCVVLEYEIHNRDTKDFHALVTRAELTEISLTNVPANPFALVKSREASVGHAYRAARMEYYDLLTQYVGLIQQKVDLLAYLATPPPAPPRAPRVVEPAPRVVEPAPRVVVPRAPTQFQALVAQINREA